MVASSSATTESTVERMPKSGPGIVTCAERRGPPRRQRAAMQQYLVGTPMERLALDVLGPLPCTRMGNKYILIVADYFSKWVEAFPMPNQEACTVADLLVKEVVCRFGVPLLIHSDQGRNFASAVFTEICQMLGMYKPEPRRITHNQMG